MAAQYKFLAGLAALALALPAVAGDVSISINDPYVRSATKTSPTGAAFMEIVNEGSEDDRLIAVGSDIAKRVELHTHIENTDGVMQMRQDEDGFEVPAGGSHMLQRGGDHVMFMGLNQPLEHGQIVTVTLTFEKAGDIVVEIPVDLERKPDHGKMQMNGDTDG